MNAIQNAGKPNVAPQNIPAELRALAQWVGWYYEERNGQRTKPPIDAKSNGKLLYARTNDPTTWSAFDTAVAAAVRLALEGVGLCLSAFDGLTGLDLDDQPNLPLPSPPLLTIVPEPDSRTLLLIGFATLVAAARGRSSARRASNGIRRG